MYESYERRSMLYNIRRFPANLRLATSILQPLHKGEIQCVVFILDKTHTRRIVNNYANN